MPKKRLHRTLSTDLLECIGADDEYVYVTSAFEGPRLFAIGHDGSTRLDLVGDGGIELRKIVVDDAVYAATSSALVRIDKRSGAHETLGQVGSWGIFVDRDDVYASILGSYPTYADGGVVRVSKRGGPTEWLVRGKSVTAIAVREGVLAFAAESQLWLLEGREQRALTPARNPHAIAFVGDTLVWTEFDNAGSLAMVNRSGGERRDLAPGGYTSGLVVIGDTLFWTQASRKKTGTSVWAMKIGSEPQAIAKFHSKAAPIAGNERIVCWIDDCSGGIGAIAPNEVPSLS